MYPNDYPGSYPGAAVAVGSWYSLLSIRQEARDPSFTHADEQLACPNDGTPYKQGPNGVLYCPWDNFRPGTGVRV